MNLSRRAKACEFRPFKEGDTDHRGRPMSGLDEVVVKDVQLVHFEFMDDNLIWCGLNLADGRTIHVHISGGKRTVLRMEAGFA